MLALLSRLRDHMSARESRVATPRLRCIAASANNTLASHQQNIEQDAIGWTYRIMAEPEVEEPPDSERMEAILEQLQTEQQILIVAWIHQERTYREIAAAQGVSEEETLARVRELFRTLNDAVE